MGHPFLGMGLRVRSAGEMGGGRPQTLPVPGKLRIRIATLAERKGLEELQLRASLTNEGDRAALLANPDAIAILPDQIAAGRVFVAELNGATVGFCAIEHRKDRDIELDALFTEPDFRRHGVGRFMVAYCAEAARGQGAKALHVIGNPHARDFYLACGFQETGTCETRFGVGVLMRKELGI